MFTPKTVPIRFPSGLRGEFREMLVSEEDLIAATAGSQKSRERATLNDRLLGACWLRITEPGPYRQKFADGKLDLGKMLIGDKSHYLVQLRVESLGDLLRFQTQCGRGHRYEAQVSLKALDLKPLTAEAAERFAQDRLFEVRLPRTGRQVRFALLIGEDQMRVEDALTNSKDELSSELLALRVREIEGFDLKTGLDAETNLDIRGFLKRLPTFDATALRDAIADVEPGVDLEAESTCKCGSITTVDVTEAATDFFLPHTRRKTSLAKS